MTSEISTNTQAILLLVAPLIVGRHRGEAEPLTPSEYRILASRLHATGREPADLLARNADVLIDDGQLFSDIGRLRALLARGFLLSQAVDRWHTRSIWVVSRADSSYPTRLRSRLGNDAPPILYGAGERAGLDRGGLAIVGSRDTSEATLEFTAGVAALAAAAGTTTISGGARGIDQAAMRAAADAGGTVTGVLADKLERAVVVRENRDLLREGRLTLISPLDPAAGFNVGHAMQRNKLIYALSDAALVASSDYKKGGTWAGAVEQLKRFHFVPVFVRASGAHQRGLEALRELGASDWPAPSTPDEMRHLLSLAANRQKSPSTEERGRPTTRIPLSAKEEAAHPYIATETELRSSSATNPALAGNGAIPDSARASLERLTDFTHLHEIAAHLGVPKKVARAWLSALVDQGVVEKRKGRLLYRAGSASEPGLFD